MRVAAASLVAIAALVFASTASPGVGRPARAVTPDYFPGTATWYEIERGHLVVGRSGEPRWRSRGLFPSRFRLGLVAASRQGVAFSYHGWLYIAQRGGTERRIARREGPVGWTAGGLYTYGRTLLLRSAAGRRIRTVAGRPQQHAYDPATGRLYLVEDGEVSVAHGTRVHRVADFRAIHLPPRDTELIPLGGLLELMAPGRIVVLGPGGGLFASTPVARTATVSSGLAVAPNRHAVAFTAATGQRGLHSHGAETVYLLRAGSHHAVRIYTQRVAFEPCERGANLTWHGHWLHYSNSEGNRAAVRV